MGKGEIVRYEQFILFPSKTYNADKYKKGLFGKGIIVNSQDTRVEPRIFFFIMYPLNFTAW